MPAVMNIWFRGHACNCSAGTCCVAFPDAGLEVSGVVGSRNRSPAPSSSLFSSDKNCVTPLWSFPPSRALRCVQQRRVESAESASRAISTRVVVGYTTSAGSDSLARGLVVLQAERRRERCLVQQAASIGGVVRENVRVVRKNEREGRVSKGGS